MSNTNQRTGAGHSHRRFRPTEYPYFNAIVEDIVVNEEGGTTLSYASDGSNIGEIRYRGLPEDRNTELRQLKTAFPLESNIQQYPLIGELVLVYKTVGGTYYTRPLNYARKIAENTAGILRSDFQGEDHEQTVESMELAKLGAVPMEYAASMKNVKTGKYFPESWRITTLGLRPCEGDVLLQGRFGNTIRLGSSLRSNPLKDIVSPSIILTAGMWDSPKEVSATTAAGVPTIHALQYENINEDKSSIWMISDEIVDFVGSTFDTGREKKAHLLSSENRTTLYDGAQIFVNSDRVILNSKKNEISLFAKKEINLSALKSITMDSEASIYLHAFRDVTLMAEDSVTLVGKSISFISGQDLAFRTDGTYSIAGKRVFIGKNGDISEPMVLGAALASWLGKFMQALLTGGILTPVGPATLNLAVMQPLITGLAGLPPAQVPQLATFNSRDNFTSEVNSVGLV